MDEKAPEEIKLGVDETINAWRSYEFQESMQNDMKKALEENPAGIYKYASKDNEEELGKGSSFISDTCSTFIGDCCGTFISNTCSTFIGDCCG